MQLRCPICRKPVPLNSADMPFCSERCRLIDLGKWASEEYSIPGAPAGSTAPLPDDDDEPSGDGAQN